MFLLSYRTAGAAPLLAWNRVLPSQSQYQPGQYQGLGGPMSYPQRPEDRMDRGRQVWKHCLIFFLVLLSSWVTLPCCVAEGCERSIGGPSWAGFSLIAMSPVQVQTNKLPLLVRSLCGCLWQKAHAIVVLLLLFIKTRSSVLPSHTRLAAWENISYRYLFWKTV